MPAPNFTSWIHDEWQQSRLSRRVDDLSRVEAWWRGSGKLPNREEPMKQYGICRAMASHRRLPAIIRRVPGGHGR